MAVTGAQNQPRKSIFKCSFEKGKKLLDKAARASSSNQQPSAYGSPTAQNYRQPSTMMFNPQLYNSGQTQPQVSFYGPPAQSSYGSTQPPQPFQGSGPSTPSAPSHSYSQTPQLPPEQRNAGGAPTYGQPQSYLSIQVSGADFWGKLITPQQTASPALISYVTALYNYLDQAIAPPNQGGLSPEKIGVLGEMQGYHGDESLYGSLKTAASHSGQGASFIDSQFTIVYNAYSLPYTTALRPATPNPLPTTTAAAYLSAFIQPHSSSMPLLTLDGLLTWTTLNILRQPHRDWIAMSKVLASIQLVNPRDGSLFPRSVNREALPERENEAAVRRNEMCEENVRRRNEGDARNLAYAARNSEISMARMRGDFIIEYDGNGNRVWL